MQLTQLLFLPPLYLSLSVSPSRGEGRKFHSAGKDMNRSVTRAVYREGYHVASNIRISLTKLTRSRFHDHLHRTCARAFPSSLRERRREEERHSFRERGVIGIFRAEGRNDAAFV